MWLWWEQRWIGLCRLRIRTTEICDQFVALPLSSCPVANLRKGFQQRKKDYRLLLPGGGLWYAECIPQVVIVLCAINLCRKLRRGQPTAPFGSGTLLPHQGSWGICCWNCVSDTAVLSDMVQCCGLDLVWDVENWPQLSKSLTMVSGKSSDNSRYCPPQMHSCPKGNVERPKRNSRQFNPLD